MEFASKTILLVEDEAIIAMTEKRWLNNKGFNVIHCTTGEKAVETVKTNPEAIDLVLMDIDLGTGMNGTQAAMEIQHITDIPLLFLSSHTEPDIVQLTDKIGSYGYVLKESNNTVLLASIQTAFRLYDANKKISNHEISLLDRVIEMSPHATWISDKNGILIKTNLALRNLFGLTDEDLVGKYNVLEDNLVEEQGYMPLVKKVFEDGKPLRITLFYDSQKLQTITVNKTEPVYLDVSFSSILDEKGEVENVIVQHTDITEAKKAEIKLAENALELKTLNATKDKLLSLLSHDLRGPLYGFAGLTDNMVNNLESYSMDEISQYITIMNGTSKKLLDLLTNLLQWSRLQTGKIEFTPVKLDLFHKAEDICILFSSNVKNKSIMLKNETSQNTFICADDNLLSTVLSNLVSNAIKFTNPGGCIRISSKDADNFVEVSVADDGIGMNDETIDKIFRIDSKITNKGTNGEEGSGLGLVICKEMIELNGGVMTVKSCPGEGTTFSFKLPAMAVKN